jgi:tryptophan-rich sensory protein
VTTTPWRRVRPVLIAAAAASLVALVGATLTDLGPWYQHLAKPAWQPPGPAFGLIWTLVFSLCAASGVVAWRAAKKPGQREAVIGLFALNGFLNVLWSLLFFRLHRPDWAVEEVIALWSSVLLLIVFLARFSWRASALLAPYLVWVSIATVLNAEVVRLNAPFG